MKKEKKGKNRISVKKVFFPHAMERTYENHAFAMTPIKRGSNGKSYDYFIFGGCYFKEKEFLRNSSNEKVEQVYFRDSDKTYLAHQNTLWLYDTTFKRFTNFDTTGRTLFRSQVIFREVEMYSVCAPGGRRRLDEVKRYLVVFGGVQTVPVNSEVGGRNFTQSGFSSVLSQFDLDKKEWKDLVFVNAPPPVAFHTALYSKKSDQMVCFGGKFMERRNNTIRICDFGEKSWKILHPKDNTKEIEPRGGHSMDYIDENEEEFIVFGGVTGPTQQMVYKNDVWIFNMNEKSWRKLKCSGDVPCVRSSHCCSVWNGKLWMFGGAITTKIKMVNLFKQLRLYNDLYNLDIKTKIWKRFDIVGEHIPRPTYIMKSGLVFEKGKVKFFIYGGIFKNYKDLYVSCGDCFEFEIGRYIDNEFREEMRKCIDSSFCDLEIFTEK